MTGHIRANGINRTMFFFTSWLSSVPAPSARSQERPYLCAGGPERVLGGRLELQRRKHPPRAKFGRFSGIGHLRSPLESLAFPAQITWPFRDRVENSPKYVSETSGNWPQFKRVVAAVGFFLRVCRTDTQFFQFVLEQHLFPLDFKMFFPAPASVTH